MKKHKGMNIWKSGLFLAIIFTLLSSSFLSPFTYAYSGIYGEEPWLQPSKEQAEISKDNQVLYFGVVEEITATGYVVDTIDMEVSYGDEVYGYDQNTDLIDVVVRSHTDVVTLDGSRMLEVQTPVVVAGYQQPDGRIEALVIGDMQTAEMFEPEQPEIPTIEELEEQGEMEEVSQAESVEIQGRDKKSLVKISGVNQTDFPETDLRYTTIEGDFSKALKWKKNVPAFKVGSLLTVSLYMEVFTGVDMNWSFPFEVKTRLLDPIRYITFEERSFRPGETAEERNKRVNQLKAMMRVSVEPLKQQKNRTMFAEAGVRLNIGFEGQIAGHDFNEKIDLLKIASGTVGLGGGLHMQVGGKHPAPLFGKQSTFGIREKITLDSDAVKCNTGCTFDLFTEDSVGISLPFFEAGVFTMGFAIQPLMIVYGDTPKIREIETTPGLKVEAIYQYDLGYNHGQAFPVSGDTPIYPEDALLLYVSDTSHGKPPQLEDENGQFDLTFKVDYKPRAMVGFLYQATMKAKKLGFGGEVRLPMMALPVPFDFDLDQIGGTGMGELSCTSKELKLTGCTDASFQFTSDSIIQPIGLRVSVLPDGISGISYDSGEIRGYGGTGDVKLKTVGLLPGGLKLVRTGTDANGNGIYKLVGTPDAKEGRYTIKIQAYDNAGGKRNFELPLNIAKIYPDQIDTELIPGQLWSQSLKFVEADGSTAADVTWKVEGSLPDTDYEITSNATLQTIPSRLEPGEYTFTITAERNGVPYSTGVQHRFTVLEPDVAAERNWSLTEKEISIFKDGYSTAAWHEELGKLALIAPGRGAVLYDGESFETIDRLDYPYHTSMAYVDPVAPGDPGWMYIFGGAKVPFARDGQFAGNVYRWDENGVEPLYLDPLDGSGPTVYDAATAVLPDGRLLVYGGDYKGEYESGVYDPKLSDETWIFDPDTRQFTKVVSANNPGPRSGNQIMTYVPELGKVVLFGQNLKEKSFLPEEREDEIWLFDPGTLRWSKAGGNNKIVLNENEGIGLVYSRTEKKLYILVLDTTPYYRPLQGYPAVTRLYSIDVSNGSLGSLIDESDKLPAASANWASGLGSLGYDENNGRLLYIQDEGISKINVFKMSIWNYALAQADSDREFIIADGQDQAVFQFNAARFLKYPEEWRVRWQSIGRYNLLNGQPSAQTVPDTSGQVTLSVTYEDFSLVKRRVATMLLTAEHISDGRRVPIGFARIGVTPVPPDTSNSVITLTPSVHDYLGDSASDDYFATKQSEITITLRSSGGYADGASAENGDFKGEPLAGRKLVLVDAEQLERDGLRFYTGTVTGNTMSRTEYDEYKFLGDFKDYVQELVTDENGQVKITLVNTFPNWIEAGEYPFTFVLADGSGFTLQESLSVVPRQLKPTQPAYQIEAFSGESFSMQITLDGVEDWNAYSCSDTNTTPCFEIVSGDLPDGVTLNRQNGKISGRPGTPGTYVAGVKIPNQPSGSTDVTVTIHVIQPLTLENSYSIWRFGERVGEPFSYALDEQVKGGTRPFTYEIVTGELPPGLTLDSDSGTVSGNFTRAGNYTVKVRITENGLPAESSDDYSRVVAEPRSVEKTLHFTIYEPDVFATSFSVFDRLSVSLGANLWVRGLDGIPVGSPEGAFEPYGKNQYFELIRLTTTGITPFQLKYEDHDSNYSDALELYYWHPHEELWKPFADQQYGYSDGSYSVTADVYGTVELEQVWERSDERFMNYYDYDHLYIAVGKKELPQPVITDIGFPFSRIDEAGNEHVYIDGFHFIDDAVLFVGGREALSFYVNYYDEDTGESTMDAVLPPGTGTKDLVVMKRGGTSNPWPYMYATAPKVPAYDLQLKVQVQSKEEMDALESGNPYPFMPEKSHLITVELVDGDGNRVGLDDVLLKGSPNCNELDEADQDSCFDPEFNLTNWNTFDFTTEQLELTCITPDTGWFYECVDAESFFGYKILSGTLNQDGKFQAMLTRKIDNSPGGGEEIPLDPPDENYPGAVIDLVISNEDGYYGRLAGNAPSPEREKYAEDTTDVNDFLNITTDALPSLNLDSSPQAYEVQLTASGGRGAEYYQWYWGGNSDIPPGIVLEKETGILRAAGQAGDPDTPDMKPGTYLVTFVVSDGIVRSSRTFTLTIVGSPQKDVTLQDLIVHSGDPGNPYPLSVTFDVYQTSYSLDVPYDVGELYIVPTLGEFFVDGVAVIDSVYVPGSGEVTVTESVYQLSTEVRINGSLIPQLPDGSYAFEPEDGWTHVSVSALVKQGDEVVAARSYTILIAREPSVELDRLLFQVTGDPDVTELQVMNSSEHLSVSVSWEAEQFVIKPYAVDPTASMKLVVDGDANRVSYLTNGVMTTPIHLSDEPATELALTLTARDHQGELRQKNYTVSVNRALSDNADLQQLAFTPELLTGGNFAGQTTMQGELHYEQNKVELYARPVDAGAKMQVYSDGQLLQPGTREDMYEVPLRVGINTVQVRVIAENGLNSRTYTVEIQRHASRNASLSALNAESVTMQFRPEILSYEATVASDVDVIKLTPVVADSQASLQVAVNDRTLLADGYGSYAIELLEGMNYIKLQVTAADGVSQQTYRLSVQREFSNENQTPVSSTPRHAPDSADRLRAQYGDEFRIEINGDFPAGQPPQIMVEKGQVPATSPGQWHLTSGYQVAVSPELPYDTKYTIVVEMPIEADLSRLPDGYEPRLFVYDDKQQAWIDLGGEIQDGRIKVETDKLGTFSLFIAPKNDGAVQTGFHDTDGHWANAWIQFGSALGLTRGYDDGSFRPQRRVTRLEFVSMLLRLTGHELPQKDGSVLSGNEWFTDWSEIPEWGAAYVAAAKEAGIVNGYPDGSFRGGETITRSEMMVMMARALNIAEADPNIMDRFRDKNEVPEWAASAIAALLEAQYVQGKGEGNLGPRDSTTRAEVIKILVEAYIDSLRK